MHTRTIVILGGHGTFGRLISAHLAGDARARVVLAGRDLARVEAAARPLRADAVRCDAADPASLRAAIAGAHLVINAAGPFQSEDYAIPSACIAAGCNYIDLGDGRAYVAGVQRLDAAARDRGVFVCLGASTTPAVTSAAVAALRGELGPLREIKIALNAGNKNQAGVSTIASILAYVGKPVRIWRDRRWQTTLGWGEGEFVQFPPPAGRRRVQVCDVPDLEIFPAMFETECVTFKAGVELTLLNYAIGVLGLARRAAPSLDLPALAPGLVRMSGLFKAFGTLHGACAVWLTDVDGSQASLAFVAPSNGPQLPAAPSVLLARKLLDGGTLGVGATPCVGLLSADDFASHLAPFGIFVARGRDGQWR